MFHQFADDGAALRAIGTEDSDDGTVIGHGYAFQLCCMCKSHCICNIPVWYCTRNTALMAHQPSARSTWLERPEADRLAWNNFRKAAGAVIAQVDADLQQQLHVGYTDIDALIQLSVAQDRSMRMAALARSVSRSPSALTRLVDRLEDRGFVARTRHSSTDVSVAITPAGLDLLASAAPRILTLVDQLFWAPLTANERDTLASICDKLLATEPPDY